jgi:N-dimethylarginine dimethylaminohydrolase
LKENCNQIFSRDIAFFFFYTLIIANTVAERKEELEPYSSIFSKIPADKIHRLPEEIHIEGGDVVLYNNFIFIGTCNNADFEHFKTARTNRAAIDYLKNLFPHKDIVPFELIKNDTNPLNGILHLDCTFMPVCNNKAIIYKNGFKHEKDYHFIAELFGKEHIFEATQEEMYYMNPNIFSIAPDIVVIEQNFNRLGDFLEKECGAIVEKIPYREISKMGGLLRCSTMPLIREND